MPKEIRSTIYMKEDMYEKFRLACNYKFGDKQGKIKKGMLMAIDFFIEVVEEEQALAKTKQQASSPEPELTGLIEEGVIEEEPRYQDKPIDFRQNLEETPTLSAKSSNQAETVPQDVAEESETERTFPVEEIPQSPPQRMVSEQQPPPNLAESSFEAKNEITEAPQPIVEDPNLETDLEQVEVTEEDEPQDVVEAESSFLAKPEEQSEGAKIVQEAIKREAEASVQLDHDPQMQTVVEKPTEDVAEKKPDVEGLAKRLAEERRKRNLA